MFCTFFESPNNHPAILPKTTPIIATMEQENKTTFGATYVPPMADVIMIELSTMAPAISAAGCLVGDGASK